MGADRLADILSTNLYFPRIISSNPKLPLRISRSYPRFLIPYISIIHTDILTSSASYCVQCSFAPPYRRRGWLKVDGPNLEEEAVQAMAS